MTFGPLLGILIGGLLLTLFSAVATKVLTELAWHELEDYCRLHGYEQKFDDIHDHADDVAVSTESLQVLGILTALVLVMSDGLGLRSFVSSQPIAVHIGILVAAAVGALATTVWIPREIARFWGPPFLVHTWRCWRAAHACCQPLHGIVRLLRAVMHRLDGHQTDLSEEEALEDEILSIVTEGEHDGLLESGVREMIAGVIELDDTDVAEIMTPRSKMDALPVDMEWKEMLRVAIDAGRTRIPVYEDNLDHIVGILYVKDLLSVLADDVSRSQASLRKIMRPVWRVPSSIRLDELLRKFLRTRSHLAIVMDEFMHVAGLVTIEDVLEEIVGEIVDESDKEEVGEIKMVSDRSAVIQARARLEDINECLGTRLPEDEEYDTIGGLLLSEFGRIPEPNESLRYRGLKITVLGSTRRRVEQVRVEKETRPNVAKAT